MTEIKLTKKQIKKLHEFKREEARIEDAYARLFLKIQKELTAKEAKWWKLVFTIAGVDKHTHDIVVDFNNNKILITERKEND